MTDFEAQPHAARQFKWKTYGGRTSNESVIHDPEFVSETPVAFTNNEKPKRRNNLMTRFGHSLLCPEHT